MTQTKRMSAVEIIAETFLMDPSEMESYRYQSTRYTSPAVYTFGDNTYYAASATKPTHRGLGGEWERHPDQFWAERAGSVLWFVRSE